MQEMLWIVVAVGKMKFLHYQFLFKRRQSYLTLLQVFKSFWPKTFTRKIISFKLLASTVFTSGSIFAHWESCAEHFAPKHLHSQFFEGHKIFACFQLWHFTSLGVESYSSPNARIYLILTKNSEGSEGILEIVKGQKRQIRPFTSMANFVYELDVIILKIVSLWCKLSYKTKIKIIPCAWKLFLRWFSVWRM